MYQHDDDFWVTHRSLGPTHRRTAARNGSRPDPLLRRLLALGLGFALLLPVFLALRGDGTALTAAPTPGAAAIVQPAVAEVARPPEAAAVRPVATNQAAAAPSADPTAKASQRTTAPTLASRPTCGSTYQVENGDYWLRIARLHGVKLAALLETNGATAATRLYPGGTVCLPAGANRPAFAGPAPSASAPARSTRSTPTTQPQPRVTAPARPTPTTAAPVTATPKSYSRQQVIDIIRYVWPDELEDRAIQIATRESNLIPTARNHCCYGLFQVYYSVHKGWLAGLGITSSQQLFDPVLNSRAALTLYRRAGSWGPWGG